MNEGLIGYSLAPMSLSTHCLLYYYLQKSNAFCRDIRPLLLNARCIGKGGQGCVFALPDTGTVLKIGELAHEANIAQAVLEQELGAMLQQAPGIVTAVSSFCIFTSPWGLVGLDNAGYISTDIYRPRLMLVQELPYIKGETVMERLQQVRDTKEHSDLC